MNSGETEPEPSSKPILILLAVLLISFVAAVASHKPPPAKFVAAKQAITNNLSNLNGNDAEDDNPPGDDNTDTQSSDEQDFQQDLSDDSEGSCHINGDLPDPICTPGVADPNVTQANISQTICVPGYTKTVRPPLSVTTPMKLASMAKYGFYGSSKDYEYDHLISLELGGAPLDEANLWPESGPIPNPKDSIANALHKLVCSGRMPLLEAQNRISTNWTTALTGFE